MPKVKRLGSHLRLSHNGPTFLLRYLLPPLIAVACAFAYFNRPVTRVEEPKFVRQSYKHIKIEVLNGCGVNGLARTVGTRLRELGFDVMTLENADSFGYPESIVIDRIGNPGEADRVAEALGIANRIQQIVPDPFRIEGVTVIVGKDYRRLGLAKTATAALNPGLQGSR